MIVYKILNPSLYHGEQIGPDHYCNIVLDCDGHSIVSSQQLSLMIATWPALEYEEILWCPPCRDEETDEIIPCDNEE